MKENFESRINWVDYAKAIGILLVVYGHVARGIKNSGIKIPTDLYEVADSVIYSFHMPLFLFHL
jgi:fucose 4-O-acetylase-like acetyltransferase